MSAATAAPVRPAGEIARAGSVRVLRRVSPGSPVACAMLFVGAGSWLDPVGKSGLAHLYEHAFFAGAGDLPDAAAVADAIAELGCRFNAHTHREYCYYYLSGPVTTAKRALPMLLDSYALPRRSAGELAKQRTAMLGELRLYAGQHQRRLRDLASGALYGDTPPSRSPLGSPAEIAELTADDLDWYAEHAATPDRAVVVLDGDETAWGPLPELLETVGARAALLPEPGAAASAPAAAYCPPRDVHLDVDAKAALLALVVPGVSYLLSRREMYAVRLFNTVLGGAPNGRLTRLLRDELGMSYQVRTSLEPHQETGGLLALAGCAPGEAGDAADVMWRTLRRALDEPVSAAELAKAREVCRGTHVHERETAVDRCFGAGYELFRRGDLAGDAELFDLWGDIGPEEVAATARRCLRLDDARIVCVGPVEARAAIDASPVGGRPWAAG